VCTEAIAGSGVGYCRPACRSNLDCGSRYCDLKTGLCGDAAPMGDPIGAACDATAAGCAGGCFEFPGTSYSACSGACSFNTPGCGQTNTHETLDYFCQIDPAPKSGDGDLGYCAKLCNCDMDCGRPDAVCEPTPTLPMSTGRRGVCNSSKYPSGAKRPNIPC
jgi:hypothetical protein